MTKTQTFHVLLAVAVLAVAAGCGNPADTVPEATVSEAPAAPAAPVSQPASGSAAMPTSMPASMPVAASQPALPSGVTLPLHPESTVTFVGSKVTRSHDGGFRQIDGHVVLVDGLPELSRVQVVIDTTSLWTDTEKLTGHLKSADFFDVATYPTATFTSTSIMGADGKYDVTGTLELHGVTKQITFPATITQTEAGWAAQAEFSIKRFDFDIVYPGRADDLIRDDVVVRFDVRTAAAA